MVRSTQPVNEQFGWGIGINADPDTGERADVSIRACLVEQNHDAGVVVLGSAAELEATVVRSNQPVNEQGGWGIGVQVDPNTGERADVSIRACLVEQNHDVGVYVSGSAAELEATVVRSTQPVNEQGGWGIGIQDDPDIGERSDVSIRACLVEQNHEMGVFVAGSGVEIEATVVRSTEPANEQLGRGINIQYNPDTGERADVSIRACLVEQNHNVGVFVAGSAAELGATVVRSTQPVNEQGGSGIVIQADPDTGERADASIYACLVEQNHTAGLFVLLSSATIKGTAVRDTKAVGDGNFGDGIEIEMAMTTIQGSNATGNARAGISNWGSEVKVTSTTITCNAFDLNGEKENGIVDSWDGSEDWHCSDRDAADCRETNECHVESANLSAPPPVEPIDPVPQPDSARGTP